MSVNTKDRIVTADLLRLAGISSYELHNWVNRGLLPRSCASIAYGGDGLRYWYPAEAVERAKDIKRLRSQGIPMQRVRKILRGEKVEL
jgi:DNA-binding transcriptional MerR regulator